MQCCNQLPIVGLTPALYVGFVWLPGGSIIRVPLCSLITCCDGSVAKVLQHSVSHSALSYYAWIPEKGGM